MQNPVKPFSFYRESEKVVMMKLCLTSALRVFVIVSRKTRLIFLGNGHPVIQSYVLRTFLNLSSHHTSYIRVSIGPHLTISPFIFSIY